MIRDEKVIYYSIHSNTALLRGNNMSQKNEYENYIKDIYQNIPSLWDDLEPLPLKNAVKHLFTTGKRLRPILAIISCESVGGNYKDVLEFIPASEGLHVAALIQDDLIDNSGIRHGITAVHSEYGVPISILASDFLIVRSYDIILRTSQKLNIPKEKTVLLFQVINNSIIECVKGECFDFFKTGFKTSLEQYIKIISLKTASQFECSAAIGAILGGGNEKQIELLSEFGRCVGMAHQIRDDILDIVGDADVMGKQTDTYLQEAFLNFVCIHALEKNASEFIEIVENDAHEKDIHESIKKFLIKNGHIKHAEKEAKKQIVKAIGIIEKTDLNETDGLRSFAKYIIDEK